MTAWDALAAQRDGVLVLQCGQVWLAGAGPGNPGLLTLDALAGLTQADVIVFDALVDRRVLALAGPRARLVFAGKHGGKPATGQGGLPRAPAAVAAAAIPATLRGINRALILAVGHDSEDAFDWAPLTRTGQPIVLYMGMRNLEHITGAMLRSGLSQQTPAGVIASATTSAQRVLISTVDRVAFEARDKGFEPPAIVVIGEIVAARDQLLGVSAPPSGRAL